MGSRAQSANEMMQYRAWLVDMDGTLYRASWLKLSMGIELLLRGTADLPVIRAFRHDHERLRAELVEPIDSPYQEQLHRTAQRLGRDAGDLQRIVHDWMIRRPAKWLRVFRRRRLLEQIETFRSSGGRTAVVSDYPAAEKLVGLGATHLFDAVVANGEPGGPGRLKPWPDGYLLAAQRLGVPAAECLVLGDRLDADGLAAQRAGMSFRLIR